MKTHTLVRLAVAGAIVASLGACNPYVWGTAAVATVPQATTGRNVFYHLDKYFGVRCDDVTYFDRPTRCVNDPD